MEKKKRFPLSQPGKVTPKQVAARVGLAPGTVSAVLNNGSFARAIPEHRRRQIQAAANELHYRPKFLARSLRKKHTYTVGIIEEIGGL
jgi:LacI family transcriptional regulator